MKFCKAFYSLGTENTITAYGKNSLNAIDSCIKRIYEIDDKLSSFKEDSEISAISKNASIKATKVSNEVFTLLKNAVKISKISNGAFDITIRPLTKLWNITSCNNNIPTESEINLAKLLINYKSLHLNRFTKTAYLKNKGQSIDLGGIAKGFAADEAKRILVDNNITSALINLGGNLVAIGNKPNGEPWTLGIQNPLAKRGDYVTTINITDKSIVTSAINERFFIKNSIRYHHILDPNNGYPSKNGLLSVTVISDNSQLADALSTATFILGLEKGVKILKQFNVEGIFITEEGDFFSTAK